MGRKEIWVVNEEKWEVRISLIHSSFKRIPLSKFSSFFKENNKSKGFSFLNVYDLI